MQRILIIALLGLAFTETQAHAGEPKQPPKAAADIDSLLREVDRRVEGLRADFGRLPADPDDRDWVKKKLAHMVEVDQFFRLHNMPQGLAAEELKAYSERLWRRMEAVDKENTATLKGLIKRHGWFRVSEWGEKADHNAWLLAQHATHDKDFMRDTLKTLEKLYPEKETSSSNYAYLYDRVAMLDGGRQRYGTQGSCVKGKWIPIEIEDPKGLDKRRKAMGLGDYETDRLVLEKFCAGLPR